MERVVIKNRASRIVQQLQKQFGALIFHQSGGCCDGSTPMLLEKDSFYIDHNDVLLGTVEGIPFYMHKDQYEYWKHTHLTIDITEGRGASFSLEIPLGLRFIIHSRLFTEAEKKYFKENPIII